MMLLRSANPGDLEPLLQLAREHGLGITTLPKEEALIQKMLDYSQQSFAQQAPQLRPAYYLFVLEDTNKHQLAGVAAIQSLTGLDTPFYSYKLTQQTRICHALQIRRDHVLLNLVNDYQGCSELSTLLLSPHYRGQGQGLLLSRGRFLFMANHPQSFANKIIAEMRGVCDSEHHSPFWQHVGAHFFDIPFKEADALITKTNKQFIADLLPHTPIYLNLLPEEAQAVVGKTHQATEPALAMLRKEGFYYNQYVHIFDAGPTLEAPFASISSIANSKRAIVLGTQEQDASRPCLLANTGPCFRATLQEVRFAPEGGCFIAAEAAELLQVGKQDTLRIVPLD